MTQLDLFDLPKPVAKSDSSAITDRTCDRYGHTRVPQTLTDYADICFSASHASGWWTNLMTGEPLERNHGEMFMLMVSEIAEAMEGHRKDLPDDKLPHRRMVEVELADCLIRIFDYAGGFGLDLEGALREKLAYNAERLDHKLEHRRSDGGKKF